MIIKMTPCNEVACRSKFPSTIELNLLQNLRNLKNACIKMLLEIIFARESLNRQDSKRKFGNFASKCDEIVLLVYFIN